jgi:hypothetical protein
VHAVANDRAMTKQDTHQFAGLRVPDLHGTVIRTTDDVLAVRRVRHRVHRARVPCQRALLLMDQTRRSKHSTQQQTIGQSQNRTLTSLLVVLSQILTVLSSDPLTMCLPSGEYATEFTQSECPVSVHFCSWPKPARQHQSTQQQTIGR